jgi:urease accessory protein
VTANLVALLHLCDSLFPIGSFAHSDGLEAATTAGQVRTSADLEVWMLAILTDTLRKLEAPSVARAWRAFSERRFGVLCDIDQQVHALRPSSAGRDASRAMGSRLLKTWEQMRPHAGVRELVSGRATFTLPVAFAVVSASAGIAHRDAVEGFMYTRLAAALSAAMRLMPLGQQEGHRLLAEVLLRVPAFAEESLTDQGPIGSFTPALDQATMSQQYGHSRLFRS